MYKAQLNLDGPKIHPGVHYNQTFASVAFWGFIRILLSAVLRNNWKIMQLDYVVVFYQAPVDRKFI